MIQDENWELNRAKTTVAYLENELLTKLKWPVQSLDLNPVENRLGFTKKYLLKRGCIQRAICMCFKYYPLFVTIYRTYTSAI